MKNCCFRGRLILTWRPDRDSSKRRATDGLPPVLVSNMDRLARERLDAASAARDIRVMSGHARILATTTTIPLGGMSGGRAR
jgi:hypothetical protein